MPVFAPLFPSDFEKGGNCARDEADKKPCELGGEMVEGIINHSRKRDHPNNPADSDRQKETQVWQELFANIRQPTHKRFVDSKHDHQHSSGKPGGNRSNSREDALNQADDPGDDSAALGFWCL